MVGMVVRNQSNIMKFDGGLDVHVTCSENSIHSRAYMLYHSSGKLIILRLQIFIGVSMTKLNAQKIIFLSLNKYRW